jgi:4-carboxymuconolactone decarboxylase
MCTGPNFDGLHTDMFELGLKIRREVVGDAYVTKALENGSSEFSYAGQQLITEYSQLFWLIKDL